MKEKGKVLVVDDEPNIRTIISAVLQKAGLEVTTASSAEEALELAEDEVFSVLVTDYNMSGQNGLELIKAMKNKQHWISAVMVTAFGTMDTVIEAMRMGVQDFLTKPFDNGELRERVMKLLRVSKAPAQAASEDHGSESEVMKMARTRALRGAQNDTNILILGESGTGKEVMARFVHENSPRARGPFVAVNCGAIPESLIESELFGHAKGAFSGAVSDRPGKVEMAEGGTLFLDEIGEMPLLMQVKLLRVLQERTLERLGEGKSRSVNFRLIAATHRDLKERVQKGEFREDLFFRLNVLPVELPPLRSRPEDIEYLSRIFLERWNEKLEKNFVLSSANIKVLNSYSWPGNIRELENFIERTVILTDGDELSFDLLLPESETNSNQYETSEKRNAENPLGILKETRNQSERQAILRALEENRWNKTKTAASLKISRRTLLYRIKALEIE